MYHSFLIDSFTDGHLGCLENPIDSTKKLLNLISEFGKTAGYKDNIQKLKVFFTPTMKYQKDKLGKNPIYYSNKKNKVTRNKPNQGGKRPVLRKLLNTEERNEGRPKQMEACTMLMDWKN